ncbi:putative ATP synthase gamma chain mitochondrial precursor [Blastocladiella britannica]|nr:putative ATP synthase gamma chain mitochondrial precursor [Blastocladiella britannica]
MLSSAVRPTARLVAQAPQAANMATLKEIQMRLKSIANIGKITKSMKMIASTKMSRAQRAMDAARVHGNAAAAVTVNAGTVASDKPAGAFVAVSSDRGLCGGIHSSITKNIKRSFVAQGEPAQLVIIGDKCRTQLAREFREKIALTYSQIGKSVPTFLEASLIADAVLADKELAASNIKIVYNKFVSVISYEAHHLAVVSEESLKASPKLSAYETEGDVLQDFHQFLFASSLHHALTEGHASEFSARRSAMDNATKNAGDMVDRLTLLYNRQRQASITNDLVDIITGASAL